MAVCEVCKHDYDKAFQVVTADGQSYFFDSPECFITALAHTCETCGCRVLGHGVVGVGGPIEDLVFCCKHCAETGLGERGEARLVDGLEANPAGVRSRIVG